MKIIIIILFICLIIIGGLFILDKKTVAVDDQYLNNLSRSGYQYITFAAG